MDAEMIIQLGDAGRHAAIPEHVRAIQAGVRHMQRQVRDLLARLRPTPLTELGLNAALRDLVRFWSQRRPDIAFHTQLLEDEAALAEAVKDVAYRVVQEAVSNAVRHGAPGAVWIVLQIGSARRLTVTVADDGRGRGDTPETGGGLGLVGMRERVTALGGELRFGPTRSAPGWTTWADINLEAPTPPAHLKSVA
jgi:two-component system sensor histidine kinase UhpB